MTALVALCTLALAACSNDVALPNPHDVKPHAIKLLPAIDRQAATIASDHTGTTAILIHNGFRPLGYRAPAHPGQSENWQVVFASCWPVRSSDRPAYTAGPATWVPTKNEAQACLDYSGYYLSPRIFRDMEGGPHFTAWDNSVLNLEAGKVKCQSAIGGTLTNEGIQAIIVFARNYRQYKPGAYRLPVPTKGGRAQFSCTISK